MSPLRLILRAVGHFWKMDLAVACGVAVATAVLTGALLVGDSMRGSLSALALEGLGRIDEVLVADHFFREGLADEGRGGNLAAPVILYTAAVEAADGRSKARVEGVHLIGCDDRFWQLDRHSETEAAQARLRRDEVIVNEPVARLLAIREGDWLFVELGKRGGIPAEMSLGHKRVSTDSMRLRVARVIPAEGLGRFALRPNQRAPENVYVSLAALQAKLDERGRVNAILRESPAAATAWNPQPADLGVRVEQTPRGYLQITTERMIFAPAVDRAVTAQLADLEVQPAFTYLANSITLGDREVPYSTITAIDFQDSPPLGPFLLDDMSRQAGKTLSPSSSSEPPPVPATKLGDGQIALNRWAADRLKARVGDRLQVTFFEPEDAGGQLRERTVELELKAIVRLEAAAADKQLTPAVRGLTDKATIESWELPFELKPGRIKSEDDRYWRKHAATPKAFVSLAMGRKLWGSRFGETTSFRIRPAAGITAETLAARLSLDPVEQGFLFRPIKRQVLEAAEGTTPFGALFLALSFFVIVAAVMLVVLLFRLGIEQRARQLGLLLAVGFPPRQVVRLLAGEGFLVAAFGSLLGVPAGIGYAALMLFGLRTWWLPAVGTPFLALHVTWQGPAIGTLSGLLVSLAAIWLAARRVARVPPRRLMAGQTQAAGNRRVACPRANAKGSGPYFRTVVGPEFCDGQPKNGPDPVRADRRRLVSIALVLLALAPAIVLLLVPMTEDVKIGAFFAAGALSLVALLALVYAQLRRGATGPAVATGRGNVLRLAIRNAARNPGRSALSIGLTAAACFLIAAVSVFRIDPAQGNLDRAGGSGGFTLIGQSDRPIYYDLNSPEGRKELGAGDEAVLAECRFYAFGVRSGDDASCRNLYRPQQPRVLGAAPAFLARGGFGWADAPPDVANPWTLLDTGTVGGEAAMPVVMDRTTANYALNLWAGRGQGYAIGDGTDRTLRFTVAGLLKDSIFQGDLVVHEAELRRRDPAVTGCRYFLVGTPPGRATEVQQALQRVLADYGFRSETTAERLNALAAVQNTYLAAFQSLGGLGLLLGTVGLAVVQWRNVLERRGELALLRAVGFPARTLAALVGLENLFLLTAGIFVGVAAALVAVAPHLLGRWTGLPLGLLAGIFASVLAVGILIGLVGVRGAMRLPILPALREER